MTDVNVQAHPRPPTGHALVTCTVKDGMVDLSQLGALASRGGDARHALAAKTLMAQFEQNATLSLDQLLQCAWQGASQPEIRDFLKQLCLQLGTITDQVLHSMVGNSDEWDEVKVLLHDPDISSDHALDRRLRLYVDATTDLLRGGLHHSYTCDKSRVGTLGLMNGFMTTPDNPGCWAVPQVIFIFLFVCLVISPIGRVSYFVRPRAVIIEG